MYCKNCGNQVESNLQACFRCGYDPKKGDKFCHSCGSNVNREQVICIKCGVSLKEEYGLSNEGKTVAIISYLTLIGFIVALVQYNANRTKLGAFHLRQVFGFIITGLFLSTILFFLYIPMLSMNPSTMATYAIIVSIATSIISLILLVCIIVSFANALNGKEKPAPIFGKLYERWFADFPYERNQKIPSTLNVLTILTLIGSALQIVQGVRSYFTAQENYDNLLKLQSQMNEAPEFVKKMMGPEMLKLAEKAVHYRMPIMFLEVAGGLLCLYGAFQMRFLKKDGYSIWLAGELLPLIGNFLLLGGGAMSGWIATLSLIFPMIFIILYTLQRKHLVN